MSLHETRFIDCGWRSVVTAFWSLVLLFAGSPQTCLAQAQNQQYTVTNLGFVYGSDLNDKGQIVGTAYFGPTIHPFIWDATNGIQDLGAPLGYPNPTPFAGGMTINNAGQMSGTACAAACRAFRWDKDTGFLDTGIPDSYAVRITESGRIVGNMNLSRFFGARVFSWGPATGLVDLGTPCQDPNNLGLTSATAGSRNEFFIIEDVTLAPGTCNASPSAVSYPAIWNAGTWTALSTSVGSPDIQFAPAVNNVGQVAAGVLLWAGQWIEHATLWTNNVPLDLGTLPGDLDSKAMGINDSGQVVGRSDSAQGVSRAFIWDATNGMRDLNSLIPPGSGVHLRQALAINNEGQILVDSAGAVGYTFLLSPAQLPTPTNLRAAQLPSSNGTQIKLTWDYSNEPIDGFIIERKPSSSGFWTPLVAMVGYVPPGVCPQAPTIMAGLVAPDVRCWVDTVPNAYATYSYRMQAAKGSTISCPTPSSSCSRYSNGATCFQLNIQSELGGTRVEGLFTPDGLRSLSQATQELRISGIAEYDHFNWVSVINHYTVPRTIFDASGKQLTAPWLDPPLGGYGSPIFQTADPLTYYWNELPGFDPSLATLGDPVTGGPQDTSPTAIFRDLPHDPLIPPGDYIGFFTVLVGVQTSIGSSPPKYTVLNAFAWSTTNTGSTGGIGRLSFVDPPTSPGSGGIFNTQVVSLGDLPENLRTSLLNAGAQGVPAGPKVDKDAPMTAAFLSGAQGPNGWYTSPVTITLIATDIDGPSDIATTSYAVDGASSTTYAGPFTILADGVHSFQFASVDLAGNVETPRPSETFKLDATPPTIVCGANLDSDGRRDHKPLTFIVLGTMTDSTSGVDPASPNYSLVDEHGRVLQSGSIALRTGGYYSFAVSLLSGRRRRGDDERKFIITLTAKDNAGNLGSCSAALSRHRDEDTNDQDNDQTARKD